MASEQETVAQLRGDVPAPVEPQPVPPTPPGPMGVATDVAQNFAFDEITQYKLHEYFDEPYRASDQENRGRLTFVYRTVAEMLGTDDYGFIVAKIRDLEQVIGTANSDRRLYRLYEWLRLDTARRKIDREMAAVTQ